MAKVVYKGQTLGKISTINFTGANVSGTLNIKENGEYDVSQYEKVKIEVQKSTLYVDDNNHLVINSDTASVEAGVLKL